MHKFCYLSAFRGDSPHKPVSIYCAMILILSNSTDVHADQVESILQQRGLSVRRLDTRDFPICQKLAIRIKPTIGDKTLYDCRWIDLLLEHEVSAIWYRRPTAPSYLPQATLAPRMRQYIEAESTNVLADLWSTLSCRWLPGEPHVIQRARHKILQLRLAAASGLEIPPTLITNDPQEAREFYRQHNGFIISKSPSGAFLESAYANSVRRYTEPVTHRDLGYLDAVKHCPILFQTYIPKKFELRCTVVDSQVFAAAIYSQHSQRTRHDWRRYDRSRTPYQPYDLPEEICRQLVELVQRLQLRYGAIDLIYTQDERYVFIEINPNGQFLFIEQATSLPISAAIAEALYTR